MEEEKPIPAFDGDLQASGVREGQVKQLELPTEDFLSPIIDNPDPHSAATRTDTDEGEWVSGIKLAVIIVALTTAAFLMLLDTSIVTTVSSSSCVHAIILTTRKAIPRITSDFHSLSDIGWYGSAYLLAK
jgi:hypothetical protein